MSAADLECVCVVTVRVCMVTDLAVLAVDLVTAQHDGDVLAHAHQILVPVRHGLVGDASSHVEHDDGSLATDVVAIAKST